MVPSSVAKRNEAEAVIGAPVGSKPDIGKTGAAGGRVAAMLKTNPVGAPPAPKGSPGAGMETTKDRGVPELSYRVETPASASATQKGEVADVPTPQGFTRFAST